MSNQATAQVKPLITAMVIWVAMVMAVAEAVGKTKAPRSASVAMDGFNLRIDRVVWLRNQMDHGIRYPMPPSMMPDMPTHGMRRLSIEITIFNESRKRQHFHAREMQLSTKDKSVAASSTTVDKLNLFSGQLAHLILQFDIVPMENQEFRLIWRRGGKEQAMMTIPQSVWIHLIFIDLSFPVLAIIDTRNIDLSNVTTLTYFESVR